MIEDKLVANACFAADEVAMKTYYRTDAERTRAIVRTALEALEANGLITVVPFEEWPVYFVPYPPYKTPWHIKIPEEK